MNYGEAFDLADTRALAKVLFLFGIPDNHIKCISSMNKNNIAAAKIGNGVSSWFCIKSGVKQGCILSPFTWVTSIDFALRSTTNLMEETGIKRRSKIFLDLDYADDLSIQGESVSQMNEI